MHESSRGIVVLEMLCIGLLGKLCRDIDAVAEVRFASVSLR